MRYDDSGEVIGVTIINARRIIEHDGYLTITLPHSLRSRRASWQQLSAKA